MSSTTVYGDAEFRDVDIGASMRDGHPGIRAGDEYIITIVARHCRSLGRRATVLELGCGSAVLARLLADRVPEADVVANEVEPNLVRLAEQRVAGSGVEVFRRSFLEWDRPLDILISWGSHHHLSNEYLDHVKRVLRPEGIFIVGDEFCPEYCTDGDAVRISRAEVVYVADGYVLTSRREVEAYKNGGRIPEAARDLEQRRQRTLWNWYKHVIDFAFDQDNIVVVLAELQIARDDIMTIFRNEHKLPPSIVERDLEIRGFRRLSKRSLAPSDPVELQSFFVYEYAVGGEGGNDR